MELCFNYRIIKLYSIRYQITIENYKNLEIMNAGNTTL